MMDRMTKLFLRRYGLVAPLLAVSLVVGGCDYLDPDTAAGPAPAAEDTISEAREERDLARRLSTAFEAVAQEVRPSVVSITTKRRAHNTTSGDPFRGAPFGDLFERFFGPQAPQFPRGPQPFPQQGLGSGFVVSEDGYIMTNHHVVDGAEEINVHTADERTLSAELVGSDPKTELAVLRVDAGELGLTPLRFGDSDELRVGQWVVAVGNPFGLSSTITAGIVSATGRSNLRIADYEDFIQTDAAINPGNSGGPLVDLNGEVVGVNTAIFSRSGGYMGIGFAIPANMARDIMDSLIEEGHVTRGWLGAWIQDLDENLARSFGFDSRDGVLIGDVDPEGPAARAGLRSGDIVLRYGDEKVESADELRFEVAATRPGSEVELEIFRDGRRRDLIIEIGELEGEEVAAGGIRAPLAENLGMTVRSLEPQLAERLGYSPDQTGAVIVEVAPSSPAADAGLRPRDVIVQVQDRAIASAADLRRALDEHDLGEGVRLTVLSAGARRFVFLEADSS